MTKLLLALALLLPLLAACSSTPSQPNSPPSPPKPLANSLTSTQLHNKWFLTHLSGQPIDATKAMRPPFLNFAAPAQNLNQPNQPKQPGKIPTADITGPVSGNSGINSLSGSYTLSPPNLVAFSPLRSTMMAGPPQAMQLESQFNAALAKVRSAGVLDQYLTLRDDNNIELARFAREVDEPAGVSLDQLRGEWLCIAIDQKNLTSDRPPTLIFSDTSTIAGYSAVNRFNGPLDATNLASGAIKMGPFAATRMAGPPELMQLEQTYLAALEKSRAISIRDAHLILSNADGELLRFRRR